VQHQWKEQGKENTCHEMLEPSEVVNAPEKEKADGGTAERPLDEPCCNYSNEKIELLRRNLDYILGVKTIE